MFIILKISDGLIKASVILSTLTLQFLFLRKFFGM